MSIRSELLSYNKKLETDSQALLKNFVKTEYDKRKAEIQVEIVAAENECNAKMQELSLAESKEIADIQNKYRTYKDLANRQKEERKTKAEIMLQNKIIMNINKFQAYVENIQQGEKILNNISD